MSRFSVAYLTALALIPSVITALHSPLQSPPSQQGTTLHPINILDYEASIGLQRRASNDLSVIEPQNQTEMMYKSADDSGAHLLAHMTLQAPDGLPIVLLEHFQELVVEINCRDQEGRLDLKWDSVNAFEVAKSQWNYVNKDEKGRFLVIANQDGCGQTGQRQGYVVSNVTYDTDERISSLAAKAVPWSDVAGTYSLDFGHAVPIVAADRLKRSWLDAVENAGKDAVNSTEGDLDKTGQDVNDIKGDWEGSPNKSFSINSGTANQRENIWTDADLGLSVDCVNCFTTGNLSLTGHLSVQDSKVQDLSLTIVPVSLTATLDLEATISASRAVGSKPFSKTLWHSVLPDAGLSIPDVFDLGTTIDFKIGGDCVVGADAVVDFGGSIAVPDSAQIVADLHSGASSSVTGFDEFVVTPLFNVSGAEASVSVSAFLRPALSFGVYVHGVGNADISVGVMLPELNATFTAESDEQGACSHGDGASKTGLEIDSGASIIVDLDVDADLGPDTDSWSTQLWSYSKALPSTCLPLSLPTAIVATTTALSSASTLPLTNLSSVMPSSSFPSPVTRSPSAGMSSYSSQTNFTTMNLPYSNSSSTQPSTTPSSNLPTFSSSVEGSTLTGSSSSIEISSAATPTSLPSAIVSEAASSSSSYQLSHTTAVETSSAASSTSGSLSSLSSSASSAATPSALPSSSSTAQLSRTTAVDASTAPFSNSGPSSTLYSTAFPPVIPSASSSSTFQLSTSDTTEATSPRSDSSTRASTPSSSVLVSATSASTSTYQQSPTNTASATSIMSSDSPSSSLLSIGHSSSISESSQSSTVHATSSTILTSYTPLFQVVTSVSTQTSLSSNGPMDESSSVFVRSTPSSQSVTETRSSTDQSSVLTTLAVSSTKANAASQPQSSKTQSTTDQSSILTTLAVSSTKANTVSQPQSSKTQSTMDQSSILTTLAVSSTKAAIQRSATKTDAASRHQTSKAAKTSARVGNGSSSCRKKPSNCSD